MMLGWRSRASLTIIQGMQGQILLRLVIVNFMSAIATTRRTVRVGDTYHDDDMDAEVGYCLVFLAGVLVYKIYYGR